MARKAATNKAPWSARLLRLLEAVVVGLGFALVLAHSAVAISDLNNLPIPLPPVPFLGLSPLGPWPTFITALLLIPALFAFRRRGHEAGSLTAIAAGILIPAAFPWANLDWTRLLKDLDLSHGGVPGAGDVAAAAAPLLYVLGYHLATAARSARRHYAAKGVPEADARAAGAAVTRLGAVTVLGGVAAMAFIATGLHLGAGGLPGPWRAGGLAAPVIAAAALAGVVLLLLRDHRRGRRAGAARGGEGGGGAA